ncbi:MAG: Na/Pi cotransporter family protein [Sneathiella sp.]|nr:Na/Pi cotransporter family protein [Sneathiella sp.]
MDATFVLINLLGGVALLLWGLRMVNTGVTRAFGRELAQVLNFSLRNRFNAFAGGLGVTMLLQSSTATALLTASFAGKGLVTAAAGLAVMLGADVGTTLVAQVLTFDLSWLAPVLLFVGFVRHTSAKTTRAKNLGRISLGLGMMLTALKLLVMASEPIRDSSVAQFLFSSLSDEPVLTVVLGALLTFVAHSSLATVLFIVSLATSGGIPLDVAFAMILGANLGGALPPILATMNGDVASRRPPFGNLICRLTAVILVLPFLDVVIPEVAALGGDTTRQIVNFHTFLNLGLAAVFIFLIGPVGRLTEKLITEKADASQAAQRPMHLDRAALESPQLALANALRDTLRMGDILEGLFRDFKGAFETGDKLKLQQLKEADEIILDFNAGVKSYLTELGREPLDDEDERRSTEILTFASNMENVGNILLLSMVEMLERNGQQAVNYSKDDIADHNALFEQLLENMKLAFNLLISRRSTEALNLIQRKQAFRDQEQQAVQRHLQRLRENKGVDDASSALHLGLLSDLRRINSLITEFAYPIAAKKKREKSEKVKKESGKSAKTEFKEQH